MMVAIFGYPPVVCESAVWIIGVPPAGAWMTPGTGHFLGTGALTPLK